MFPKPILLLTERIHPKNYLVLFMNRTWKENFQWLKKELIYSGLETYGINWSNQKLSDIYLFDGASNVQLGGRCLKGNYHKLTVMPSVEHTV